MRSRSRSRSKRETNNLSGRRRPHSSVSCQKRCKPREKLRFRAALSSKFLWKGKVIISSLQTRNAYMQKLTTIITIFTLGVLVHTVNGQTSGAAKTSVVYPNKNAAKTEYADKDVVDLEQQYTTLVAQKKDGTHELYRYPDGSKVLLTIRGGKPVHLSFRNSNGQSSPISRSKKPKPFKCPWVVEGHSFTVGCSGFGGGGPQ